MASKDYVNKFFKRYSVNLHKDNEKHLIEWLELLKSNRVSMNQIFIAALNDFMDKHEFDTVEELKEYISKE